MEPPPFKDVMQAIKETLKGVRVDAGLTQQSFGEVVAPPGKRLRQWDVAKMEARIGSSTSLPVHLEDLFYVAARLDRTIRLEVGGVTVVFSPSATAEEDAVAGAIKASGLPEHDRDLLLSIHAHMRERQTERHTVEADKPKAKRGRRYSVDDGPQTAEALYRSDKAMQLRVERRRASKRANGEPIEDSHDVP